MTAPRAAYVDSLETHCASGTRALRTGDLSLAQSEFVAALTIDRDCVGAAINLATVFFGTGRPAAAEAMARRAVKISDSHAAWNNLGYIQAAVGKFDAALTSLQRSLEIEQATRTWHLLGMVLQQLGRFDEAVAAYDECLKREPDNIEFTDHRGQALLGMGRLTEGLIDNKIRWQHIMCHPLMSSEIAVWNGEPLEGKSIVVLHEQGFGDLIQCVRWVPLLKSRCKARRVILSVPESIITLMGLNKLADEVIGVADEPSGVIDYKIPSMTVPALFEASDTNIPGKPYIKAPLRKAALPKGDELKVGLVWGGKPMYSQDQWRSMDPTLLLPLFEIEGVSYYSLQADERGQQLWQSGIVAWVKDLAPMLRDWSDTAALLKELDLLVSVDTGPAHLAGAMGKSVALMVPQASCWRWFGHETTTTPWYPSMRIFRQQRQGDWAPVIAAVAEFICQFD